MSLSCRTVPGARFGDVQKGDSIAVSFEDRNLVISGLTVKRSRRGLYVDTADTASGGRLYLAGIDGGRHRLVRLIRVERTPDYRMTAGETDFTRFAPRRGTRAELERALEAVQRVSAGFEHRTGMGDLLFDRYLVDAREAADAAVRDLTDLLAAFGHRPESTGN